MSKKKQSKENHAEELDPSKMQPLLKRNAAFVSQRNKLLLYTEKHNALCGRDYMLTDDAMNSTRRPERYEAGGADEELNKAWRMYVANQVRTPLLYPYHELSFSFDAQLQVDNLMSLTDGNVRPAAFYTAELCERILLAHIKWSNEAEDRKEKGQPESILGTTLFATGYVPPDKEEKDCTFKTALPPVRPPTERQLHFLHHNNASHINVCCGLYYYKLEVVDSTGCLKSMRALAEALEFIAQDAFAADKSVAAKKKLSPDDRQELSDCALLLSHVSTLDDDVAADIRRRLEETSDVNRYTLDTLDSGLFTLVLSDPDKKTESQWLYSALSVYTLWERKADHLETTLRLHATAASIDLALAFVDQVCDIKNCDDLLPNTKNINLINLTASGDAVLGFPLKKGGESLALWLPEKHRTPLRPFNALDNHVRRTYTDIHLPVPVATRLDTFCLRVVQEVEGLIARPQGGENRAPRVLVAMQLPNCHFPSAVLLESDRLEQLLRATRSDASAVLLLNSEKQKVYKDAVASVRERLQACFVSPQVYHWRGLEEDASVSADVTDVVISITFVSLDVGNRYKAFPAGTTCLSDFAIPAAVHLHCTVEQQCAQKHVQLVDGVLTDVKMHVAEPFSSQFGELGTRIEVACQKSA